MYETPVTPKQLQATLQATLQPVINALEQRHREAEGISSMLLGLHGILFHTLMDLELVEIERVAESLRTMAKDMPDNNARVMLTSFVDSMEKHRHSATPSGPVLRLVESPEPPHLPSAPPSDEDPR